MEQNGGFLSIFKLLNYLAIIHKLLLVILHKLNKLSGGGGDLSRPAQIYEPMCKAIRQYTLPPLSSATGLNCALCILGMRRRMPLRTYFDSISSFWPICGKALVKHFIPPHLPQPLTPW